MVVETQESLMERVKLSVGSWATIITIIVTLGGVGMAVMSRVFASKVDVHELEITQTEEIGVDRLQEWRILTVETKVDNMQAQQTRIDRNIEKLLGRFEVRPEPRPAAKPLPPMPRALE